MQGKRILLGITGGIAAYKIAFLVRSLKKLGAEVKIIMTPASFDFISPLVLATLSENEVHSTFWEKQTGKWNNHVDYGLWADLFVVAPLTANTLAKMATGTCDNLLLASYFSMKCPTLVAPAMDLDMYAHPTTTRNLAQLAQDGVRIIPAESGELASGLIGEGRMAEPETIVKAINAFFDEQQFKNALNGKKILITAGPTYEAIDPVRFIGNHSSGKMGFALAEKCLNAGAEVQLISGPTKETIQHPRLTLHPVTSANEMLQAVQHLWHNMDCGIFSAAVADYAPAHVATQKIKKSTNKLTLQLTKNVDIAAWAGEHKKEHQLTIGFALETNDAKKNAASKLTTKNLNFIVINTLEDAGAGFSGDTNKIHILDNHTKSTQFELKHKAQVAEDIVNYLINYRK